MSAGLPAAGVRLADELQHRRAGATLGSMRLLECFAPLFSYGLFIDEHAGGNVLPDAFTSVRDHARALVEQARRSALAFGQPLTHVEMAGFAAVAWFDEVVARHEGLNDHARPLQLALFHTGSAASEFFDHLAALSSDAEEVREVFSMALLLGFVGQYYYEQGDSGELGRIKALHCRPCVTAGAVLQALHRESITPQPYQVPNSPVHQIQAPWVGRRAAPLVAGVLVLLVLVAFVVPVFSHMLPAQAWYLLGMAVAMMGVLGWAGVLAWHRLVLRRAHTRVAENPDAGYGIGDVWAALADAARHVRGALLHPFRRRGEWRQMSRHPWLLFVGDGAGQVRNLLQAAARAPHARALLGDEAAKPWHWWSYRALVAIEPGAPLVRAPEDPRAEGSPWVRALSLLARERRKLPLDGMVICIAADRLLEQMTAKDSPVPRLYGMVDEAARRLQLQLPLYVVVTGLESLPGYASFRAALPPAVLRRAMGWRVEGAVSGRSRNSRMDVQVSAMLERLRAVAMAALADGHAIHGRRDIFEFLWSLYGLQDGLQTFLGQLFAGEAIAGHRLHSCGVYLTAGPQVNAPGGDFVEDLFNRFLPGDWQLARRVAAPPVTSS
ncbi:type VI secretion protein IcmF/TssM N-terminal domain-containing protein [Dyella sp. 20L07]|uniref:type VI secretion protein IcmF/TssM N-terminal domain-containing protein n=1 Tax=Dyella sp. 20L07 TaxID=3384240 RepID=UPI003D28366B